MTVGTDHPRLTPWGDGTPDDEVATGGRQKKQHAPRISGVDDEKKGVIRHHQDHTSTSISDKVTRPPPPRLLPTITLRI